LQLKKAYMKFFCDRIGKEFWRSYEAIVGTNEADMEKVINGFTNDGFYKMAKDFLVTQGKFMTEDHLLIFR
jgi:hypothetical protein